MTNHLVVVPGGLNTDIIGLGVDRLLGAGELTLGGELKIGPGGKARNMAQMAASYLGKGKVAMMGRSSRDPFGLWKSPLMSLQKAGVDISFVKILEFDEAGQKFPGIAIIPVDKSGKNQIYVLPGVNADFCRQDLDQADILFENPDRQKIMMLALEIPVDTVRYALEKASQKGIRIILDPGGISEAVDDILDEKIFLIKPNEHEVKMITGLSVADFSSAKLAAEVLLGKGVQNVLITHGARGAYLFNNEISMHLPVLEAKESKIRDETGCGDQVTAIMAACLAEGRDLVSAAKLAIIAGTMQFHRAGIQPVEKAELFETHHMLQEN